MALFKKSKKEEETGQASSSRIADAVRNIFNATVQGQQRAVQADQAVARAQQDKLATAARDIFNATVAGQQAATRGDMGLQQAQRQRRTPAQAQPKAPTQRSQDAAAGLYSAYLNQQESLAEIQRRQNQSQADTMAGLYANAADSLRGANELYQKQLAGTDTGNRANELMTQPVLQRANQRQSSLESGDPKQGAGKYLKYMTAADFAVNSQAKEGNKDATYNYINNLNGERERQQGYAMQRGADSGLEKYQLMTDAERGVYNYLYNTQGKTAANGFLARIEPELNEQYFSGQSKWQAEQANQDDASRFLWSTATVAQQPVRSLASTAALAEDVYRTMTGQGIDPNSELRRASALTEATRRSIAEHYNEQYPNGILGFTGGDIYNTIMSAADSAMNAAFSYAGGQMLSALRGVNDIKKIEAFTNKLGSALMSSEVAATSVAESKEKGYTDLGAMSLGLVRGYIEYMSEKLGGEWAISWMRKSPLNPAKVILQTMIPEGVEELMSDFGNETVNMILDNLLGTKESYIKEAYDYFKENGSENPWRDTLKTIWAQEVKSFVGGALAAFGTGTSIYAQNRGIINETATRLHTDGEGIVKVMEDMNTDNPSAVYRLATLTKADSVEALQDRYQQVAEAFEAKSLDDLNDMLEQALEDGENLDQRMIAIKAQGAQETENAMRTNTGGLTYATESGKIGDVTYDVVDQNKLSRQQKNIVDVTNRIAQVLGVNVTVIDARGDLGGAYLGNGNIYLNIGAGANLKDYGKAIASASFTHELTHWMQDQAKEEYEALKRVTIGSMSSEQLQQLIREQMENQPDLTPEQAMDEVVANACQNLLQDSKAFAQLARENQTLAQKILDFLREFTRKIRSAFAEVDFEDNLQIYHAVQAVEDHLDEMQAAFDEAMLAARGNAQTNENTAGKGGVKYQKNSTNSEVVSIKQQIRESEDILNAMKPVATLSISDLPEGIQKQRQWAVDRLKSSGYAVNNQKIGRIEFTPRQINTGMNYLDEPGEIAAFAALPSVLKRGEIIDSHERHKNRPRGSITIAAPVVINGVRGNMAVALTQTSRTHYHTHRIVMPDGSSFEFENINAEAKPAEDQPMEANVSRPSLRRSEGILPDTEADVKQQTWSSAESTGETVGVTADEQSESVAPGIQFSRFTWNESDYVQNRTEAARDIASALGVSRKTAERYIDSVNGVAKAIADDAQRLDYEASPGRSSLVGNTEYGGSIDFSTLCKKRRVLTGTFTAIQNALPNTALTAEEVLQIRKMMKDRGYEVSCGLCYVEGSRAKMGEYAKQFLDEYAKTDPEYLPNMAEINTPDGLEDIRREHPEVYEAYEKFMNKLAQRKPKLYQLATEYKNEILKKFRGKKAQVDKYNRNGGLRLQSFSDFEIIHLIDNMQVIMDMARVGLNGQAYTKVPEFAWAMGRTGLKINLSLIAEGVDENGNLILDEVEGMKRADAAALRNSFSDTVGTIVVVFNDEQLKAAMKDEFIDFIIPFHRSQWNKAQYALMGLPEGAKDYTPWQNESYAEPVYNKNGKPMRPDNYMPNEYWDFSKTGKENAETYLRMCAQNNRTPKFSNLLDRNADGSYSLKKDGSTDGYWKLLIDFKMYNNDGVGVPQQPVQPIFNDGPASDPHSTLGMLEAYKGGHQSFPVAQDVVDDFVKQYKQDNPRVQYQTWNREQDTEYMSAVEDGDTRVQERMVQEAAMSAGAIEDPKRPGKPLKLYHGTPSFGFTEFNTPTIFTTDNPSISSGYGGNRGYAEPRRISDVYTPDDGSFDTLKKNSESIMGRSIRKATDEDRKKIIEGLQKTAEQLQERQEKLWTDEATDALYKVLGEETFTSDPDEYGFTREADYDNAWAYMNLPIWDMTGYTEEEILEPNISEDIRNDLEKHFAYREAFRKALTDHWDEIKGTPAEDLASFIRSFELGDLAIDMQYSLIPSLREDAIVYEDTGKVGTEENLREFIEKQKDLGSYELYGFAGDNQLVVDCKGKIWYNLTVPGLVEESTTTDSIMKKAKEAGYTSVLFKDLLDPAMNNFASNLASNVYVFFDPSQVKSADRVTYDDNGDVIPLSERFEKKNPDIRFQTWSEGPVYNNRALVSEETLDKWMSSGWYGSSNPDYAQAYIVYMTPSKFLRLTTIYDAPRIRAESEGRTLEWAQNVSETQPIQLRIDTETGKVVGHEGRHRMVVLERAGVEYVPVLMFDSANKYSKQPMTAYELHGEDSNGNINYDSEMVYDVYPLSRKYRDNIIGAFSKQTASERIKEKYDGARTVRFQKIAAEAMDREHNSWAPTFYSKLQRTVEDWTNGKGQPMGSKMSAGQVLGWLKGKGVKAEEIRWSGIEPWLEGKKSVTRDELLRLLAENQIQIETETLGTVKGLLEYEFFNDYDYETLTVTSIEETADFANYIAEQEGFDPELIRTTDNESSVDYWRSDTGEVILHVKKKGVTQSRWGDYKLKGGSNYREILLKMPSLGGYQNRSMQIHWGTKDVIAHARVQDMRTTDGQQVLFVEEIQSDLHNQGVSSGGFASPKTEEYRRLDRKRRNGEQLTENETRRFAQLEEEIFGDQLRHLQELRRKAYSHREELDSLAGKIEDRLALQERVVDVTEESIKDWIKGRSSSPLEYHPNGPEYSADDMHNAVMAAMRVMDPDDFYNYESIREDFLAWERAKEEYNEEQRRESYSNAPDVPFAGSADTYHEYVMKHMLRLAAEGDYDYVGWTTAQQQSDRWSDEYAEGYRIEYDQNIPKFMNKYSRQWGSKVETIHLDNGQDSWGVPVTASMKQDVLAKGQPLFQTWNNEQSKPKAEQESDKVDSDIAEGLTDGKWKTVEGIDIMPDAEEEDVSSVIGLTDEDNARLGGFPASDLFGPTTEEREVKATGRAAKEGNAALKEFTERMPDDPMDLIAEQTPVTTKRAGEEKISTKKGAEEKTTRERISDAWHRFVRSMANDGDAIHQAGRRTGNKALDGMFFYAKAATLRAQQWIQGKRTSFNTQDTGEGLNAIFDPIRAKGDDYYRDFQLYMYHMLNVERMSRSNGTDITVAKETLSQMAAANPELAAMSDDELERRARQYREGGGLGFILNDEQGEMVARYWETKKELMRAERQQNKPVFGFEDDAPDADASKKIAQDLIAAHPEFEQEAQKVYDYTDALLQYRVDAGLITEADMANLKSIYPHYVPVMYDFGDAPAKIRKGGLTVSSTIKSAKGGNTTLLPLHYALAKQTLAVMRNAGYQQLGAEVLKEYENNESLMSKWVLDTEESDAAWEPGMADNDDVQRPHENVITVFRNGKRYDMTLSEDMAYAFNSLQGSRQGWSDLGFMIQGNNLFKKLCTAWNPFFIITNPIRDVQDALFYSTDTKRWMKNYPKAIAQISGSGKYWEMYKSMGAVNNSYFDWATGENANKKGGKPGKVEALNLAIEQAPRLAEYMTVLENAERDHGEITQQDLMEAFNAAAEITTNFSRGGTIGRWVNRNLVPFWNPGVQGLSKAVRTVTETKGFKNWALLGLKAAALGMVPALLNGLLYRDDDEWDIIDDQMKTDYYLFKTSDGVWIKIPKGRMLAALSAPVVGAQEALRGDQVDWGDLGAAAIGAVAPNNPLETNLLSTLFQAQLWNPDNPGKTWYGGDIESQRLRGYAPGERYDESTDLISKWLGGKLNISPKKISYVIDQYSGVLGDLVLPYLTPKAERGVYVGDVAVPFSNAFMSRFTTDTVTSNTIGDEYYGLLDQLGYKAKAGDTAAAQAERYMNRAGGAVSDYYAQIRKIENDENLTDKEKSALVRELRKQLNVTEQQITADAQAYLEAAQRYIESHPEYDYTDDDAVNAFTEGYNSIQTAEKYYIDADAAAKKMKDEVYLAINREHFGAEYALQIYGKDTYAKAQKLHDESGLSYEDYFDYYFGSKYIYADKDSEGKSISGSKKEKVVEYIDGLDISDEQKDALFKANNYKDLKTTPWHGGNGRYTSGSRRRGGRRGGGRKKNSAPKSAKPTNVGKLSKGYSSGIDISELFPSAASTRKTAAGTGLSTDLAKIIDSGLDISELFKVPTGKTNKGRTSVDFKL